MTSKNEINVDVHNKTSFEVQSSAVEELVIWFTKQEQFPMKDVSVAVVNDAEMGEINEYYHNENGPTDVLSFDYEDESGEIILDPYQHRRQAGEFGNTTNEEFLENLLHALLHLSGYDHTLDEGEHLERQSTLVEQFHTAHDDLTLIEENDNPSPDDRS